MDELLKRITIVPGLCGGKPTIRAKRMTVTMLLENLAGGDSFDEILESFPFLEKDDIYACLLYAAKLSELSPVSTDVLLHHA
ncbi:MAG TPA: DUF433 domain-containing protein [Mucilaginibacter sp.]|jgi:uncharacterized protein (DUF433 family)|nr:DUF433 domain-containing protein [Mucilaginibacter sp.]